MKSIIKQGSYNVSWVTEKLLSHPIKERFSHIQSLSDTTIFYFKSQVTSEIRALLEDLLEGHDPTFLKEGYSLLGKDLIIGEYLDSEVYMSAFNMIDFKRHLKPPLATQKKVCMNPDGRPSCAEYYLDGKLVAKIRFVFRNFPNSTLLMKRAEVLTYPTDTGSESPFVILKCKSYDLTDQTDLVEVMQEKSIARSNIVTGAKGAMVGILSQAIPDISLQGVSELVQPMFTETAGLYDSFIELGSGGYRQWFIDVDVTDERWTWLAIDLGGGFTVRDFWIDRLTYQTLDTHPQIEV